MTFRFLDPREQPLVSEASTADRPGTLANQRIALLDNSKANSRPVLEDIASLLEQRHRNLRTEYFCKETSSRGLSQDLLDTIVSRFDAAITGIGD